MTTIRRNVALVIEGMGSSTSSSAGIAWHYGKASIGTPGNYEWRGGTGAKEGLIRPPDSVGCSVDRFECQLQGNAHTFQLHASGLAKALFLGRPTKPRDVLAAEVSESDTTLTFNGDFYTWSSSDNGAVVWIGDEAVKLGTYGAGPVFTSCTRGFWSTTACGQPAGMNVYSQNPKIVNRRAQLLVYDRDAGTTTQAWQGFVQDGIGIDNGVITVPCQDIWSRIVGAKVNRKSIDHSSSLGRGIASGGQVKIDEQIIRAGGVRLPDRYTSGVHKLSAPSPKWHSFQAVGAVFHAKDEGGGWAYWRDKTSGASGDSAAQLGSSIDPDLVSQGGGIKNAPLHELFIVDRIRDEANGYTTAADIRSSTRYLSKPYHPVSISMALLTSSWGRFVVTYPTDAIVFFDETTARWQDASGTVAATNHGHPVHRIDNDGALGGHFTYTSSPPSLDTTSDAERTLTFAGSGFMSLNADHDELTIVSGQGFEIFVVITNTTQTGSNKGVAGKWNVGGSTGEWILMNRDFNSPNAVLFGPKNYYNRGASGDQVNDGNPHILGGRVSTSDVAFVSIDGTDVDSGTTVTALPSNGGDLFRFGSYDNSGTTNFSGRIGELHVFDYELSGAQRSAMISYLSTKWGV